MSIARFDASKSLIEDAKLSGKKTILVVGPTRAGKSTTIAFLQGHKILEQKIMSANGKKNVFLPENYDELVRDHKIPVIGTTAKNETIVPELFAMDPPSDLLLCDTPGLMEELEPAERDRQNKNNQSLTKAITEIKGMLFVLDATSISAQGGTLFIALIKRMKELFQPKINSIESVKPSIVFVMTKMSHDNDNAAMFTKLQEIKENQLRREYDLQQKLQATDLKEQQRFHLQQELDELKSEYPVWDLLLKQNGENFVFLTNKNEQGSILIDPVHREAIFKKIAEFKPISIDHFNFQLEAAAPVKANVLVTTANVAADAKNEETDSTKLARLQKELTEHESIMRKREEDYLIHKQTDHAKAAGIIAAILDLKRKTEVVAMSTSKDILFAHPGPIPALPVVSSPATGKVLTNSTTN